MECPQGSCIKPLEPALAYSWNGPMAYVWPPPCIHGMATRLMYGKAPNHVVMAWPQGLCMEPLGRPSCIHGAATRLLYGAPLMYSWNGHKTYVWSH